MTRLLCIVFTVFYFLSAKAQQPLYSHYKWFKVEDGLPQSFISGLVQDKDGFLWIGTRDGLARYDGREFKTFRQNDKDSFSLSSNVITDLLLDAENLLWIFYINEKVDCFDPQRMQVCFKDSFLTVKKLLAELNIQKFRRDGSGRFWFNSNYKGVVCYDPKTNKTTRYNTENKTLHSNNNLGIVENAKGQLYVFTDKGIELLKTKDKELPAFTAFDPSIDFKFVYKTNNLVAALPDGRLILTETNRLIIFDPVKKNFSSIVLPIPAIANQNRIQHLKIGNDGLLYIVASGAVYRMEKNGQITWLWQSDSINPFANDARSFLADRSGVLWFGTNAAGMYKINMQALPFRSVSYKTNFTTDVLAGNIINPAEIPATLEKGKWAYGLRFCYDREKNLWLTYRDNPEQLEKNTVYIFHKNTFSSVPFPQDDHAAIAGLSVSPSGFIYGMDILGNIWKWENIHSLPQLIPSALSLPTSSVVVDMEKDERFFWVSTNKEGLFKIENDKVVHHFSKKTEKNYWPTDQLTDLCPDPLQKDILWVGTLGQGLVRLNKTNESFHVFTTEDGLPNNTVYSIVPDRNGNLWISTNKGISRFTPATNTFYNFDVKDGLIGNEFNRFHHLLLPDGRIAFGGPDGYTLFDPTAFTQDTFQTSISLTKILINNKQVDFSGDKNDLPKPLNQLEQLNLPYNKNFLQLEFAGMQFNQPEKIRYRYMLKGYDKDWIMAGHYNIASYTRIPPGRYTLFLNATNTSGMWSPMIKQLNIRIRPPFWATWWAYIVYILIVLLLARIYWRHRTNKIRMQNEIALEHSITQHLKEVDEIKNRFFSNITHELRTPLTLILTPLEKLKQENRYSPADHLILSNAYNNAVQLLRLINQLLDISKIESGQMKVNATVGLLSEFAERCCHQFSMQAKEKNIQLEFSNESVSGHYLFDEEKWEKIIFNLLSNAIKFTSAGGKVTITLSENNGTVRLAVADTGIGIHEEDTKRLFDRFFMADDSATRKTSGTGIGLSLVKELTELMKGKIEVTSNYGHGSTFIVEIPSEKITDKPIPGYKPDEKIMDFSESKTEINFEEKKEGPLVLVVEDNDELRSFLVETLSANWRIIHAANGRMGWEMVLHELPDVVISDVMMPEMDGFELCKLVKDDIRTGHISFILLTAKAAHESRIAGLKKGADVYLTKPFHFDELDQRLQNLIQQQERLRKHLQKELLPVAPLRKLPHVNDLFIQELYRQLDKKLDAPNMSVEMLAQAMNMSQRTLNRKLKAILNTSPVEFIRHYRLQKAAILLSSGYGIADAAYSVGFETASYFTQCFKEQYGKTPTEFAGPKTA